MEEPPGDPSAAATMNGVDGAILDAGIQQDPAVQHFMEENELRDVLASDQLAMSTKYGFAIGHWDQHAMTTPCEAIKEIFDNCIQKADKALDPSVTPWNGTAINIFQGQITIRQTDVLFVSDNGRGLDRDGFIEGFHNRAHSRDNAPRALQHNSISQFGIGSKDADQYLATDVYYLTNAGLGYTLIGRAGKAMSEALGHGDLRVVHQIIPDDVRLAFASLEAPPVDPLEMMKDHWIRNGEPIKQRQSELHQLSGSLGASPFWSEGDHYGLRNILTMAADVLPFGVGATGFVRMLITRPERRFFQPYKDIGVKQDPEGNAMALQEQLPGLKYRTTAGCTLQGQSGKANKSAGASSAEEQERDPEVNEVDLGHMLEQNYLFPPPEPGLLEQWAQEAEGMVAVTVSANGAPDPEWQRKAAEARRLAELAAQEADLRAEQRRIVCNLLPPGYYDHPLTNSIYSPKVEVQEQVLQWSNNVLLKHLRYKHSEVIEIPPDAALYGDSGDEVPARVVVTYLGNTEQERLKADRQEGQGGVSVYVGCRRVCEPEPLQGGVMDNWSLGGLGAPAADHMEHIKNINDWHVFHQTKNRAATKALMGDKLFTEVWKAGWGTTKMTHFLIGRGAHITIVVRPGQLELVQDKKRFMDNMHAQRLLMECYRRALQWIANNPPDDCVAKRAALHAKDAEKSAAKGKGKGKEVVASAAAANASGANRSRAAAVGVIPPTATPPKATGRAAAAATVVPRAPAPLPPKSMRGAAVGKAAAKSKAPTPPKPAPASASRASASRAAANGTASKANGVAAAGSTGRRGGSSVVSPPKPPPASPAAVPPPPQPPAPVPSVLGKRGRGQASADEGPGGSGGEAGTDTMTDTESDSEGRKVLQMGGTRSWTKARKQTGVRKTAETVIAPPPPPVQAPPPPPTGPHTTTLAKLLDALEEQLESGGSSARDLVEHMRTYVSKQSLTTPLKLNSKAPAWMTDT